MVEFIDVGGSTLIRAAAKNYNSVVTLCDPNMYQDFMVNFSKSNGKINLDLRKLYASKVFLETSKYDSIIFNKLSEKTQKNSLPNSLNVNLNKAFDLRYGENPYQDSSFYMLELYLHQYTHSQ